MAGKTRGAVCAIVIDVRQWLTVTTGCCHWSDCSAIGWRRSRLAFLLWFFPLATAAAGRVQRLCLLIPSGVCAPGRFPSLVSPGLVFRELFRSPLALALVDGLGFWARWASLISSGAGGTRANQS